MEIGTESEYDFKEEHVLIKPVGNDLNEICQKIVDGKEITNDERKILKTNILTVKTNDVDKTKNISVVIGIWTQPQNRVEVNNSNKFIVGIYEVSDKKFKESCLSWSSGKGINKFRSNNYDYQDCKIGDPVWNLKDNFDTQTLYINTDVTWNKENILKLATRYNQFYNSKSEMKDTDFTWILEEDRRKIETSEGHRCLQWGIPNQIIGDPQNANFYLCLFNPRVRNSESSKDNLKEYIHSENNDVPDSEFHEEKDKYYKQITFDVNEENNNRNILAQELRYLISDCKDNSGKISYDKLEININKKSEYYLLKYYWPLFKENENEIKKDIFKKLLDYNDEKLFDNLKVCDLELLPYRSDDKSGVAFKNGYGLNGLSSTMKVAKLIVDRIQDENKPFAYFVCRSFGQWKLAINKYLKISKSEKTFENIKEHFYKFPNASGELTQEYITKRDAITRESKNGVKTGEIKDLGIDNKTYINMKKSIGICDVMQKLNK